MCILLSSNINMWIASYILLPIILEIVKVYTGCNRYNLLFNDNYILEITHGYTWKFLSFFLLYCYIESIWVPLFLTACRIEYIILFSDWRFARLIDEVAPKDSISFIFFSIGKGKQLFILIFCRIFLTGVTSLSKIL